MMRKAERIEEASKDKKRKKTTGWQRIEINRIDSGNVVQVGFSKRRNALFKKASVLSVLCGAHVAAIVFSPGGKPFSFGHPSVHAVVDRFIHPSAPAMETAPMHPTLLISEFKHESNRLATALVAEARKTKALDTAMRQQDGMYDVNRTSLPDLLAMLDELQRTQAEAAERAQEIVARDEMIQRMMNSNISVGFHYRGASMFTVDGHAPLTPINDVDSSPSSATTTFQKWRSCTPK